MKISFMNTTQAGNNLHTYMYFNGLRVGEIHCTPVEFTEFTQLLHAGNEATGGQSEDIVIHDKH